jgi:putative colanic acid biosynthesis UDP-glucose lipid carrier transferase
MWIFFFLWLIIAFYCKTYVEQQAHDFSWHLRRLILAELIYIGFIFIYLVASKSHFISRQFLLIFFPLEIILLLIWHICRRQIMVVYRSHGKNFKRVIIIGDIDRIAEFSVWAEDNPAYGYHVEKALCYDGTEANYALRLKEELKVAHYDELIVLTGGSFGILLENQIQNIIDQAENYGLRVMIAPSYMRSYSRRIQIDNLDGQTVLSVRSEPLQYLHNRVLKRLFDFLLSSIIFLLFYWWFHLIVGIVIKLSSPGPILFKQKRIGINDRSFTCYKFRTMYQTPEDEQDAENGFGQITAMTDHRVTRIGKLLRKTNLDELPQFLNVLIGNMSVVGPRPHMLEEDLYIRKKIPKYRLRQFIKPGITGWAAVNGYRGGTEDLELMKKRTEYDIWYVENWTFDLDLKIVLKTIWQMVTFQIPNAY